MSWYEREVQLRKTFLLSGIISIVICGILSYFSYIGIIQTLPSFYKQIIISIFFLSLAQILFATFWIRKGIQSAFIIVSIAAYISLLWLIFPLIYIELLPLDELRILLASYFAGAIFGSILPIAIIKEIRPKEGITTVSVATTALSAADVVSKTLIQQSVFPSYIVQIAILGISFLLSGYFYKKLTR